MTHGIIDTLEADSVASFDEPPWATWVRQAAQRARQNAVEGIARAKTTIDLNGVQASLSNALATIDATTDAAIDVTLDMTRDGIEAAQAIDLAEVQASVSTGLGVVKERVSTAASTAGAIVQEKGQAGLQLTRDYSQTGLATMRNGASTAAEAARGAVGDRLSGFSAITISPIAWAKFVITFVIGCLFIAMSLLYIPLLVVDPSHFACMFTVGSVTVLSSFVFFSSPKALLRSMAQRQRRLCSFSYVVGLVGTLWATMYMKDLILTACFAVLQAVALLFFIASYLPGGKAILKRCCGCCCGGMLGQ